MTYHEGGRPQPGLSERGRPAPRQPPPGPLIGSLKVTCPAPPAPTPARPEPVCRRPARGSFSPPRPRPRPPLPRRGSCAVGTQAAPRAAGLPLCAAAWLPRPRSQSPPRLAIQDAIARVHSSRIQIRMPQDLDTVCIKNHRLATSQAAGAPGEMRLKAGRGWRWEWGGLGGTKNFTLKKKIL